MQTFWGALAPLLFAGGTRVLLSLMNVCVNLLETKSFNWEKE
jgi:hypothetical protein